MDRYNSVRLVIELNKKKLGYSGNEVVPSEIRKMVIDTLVVVNGSTLKP